MKRLLTLRERRKEFRVCQRLEYCRVMLRVHGLIPDSVNERIKKAIYKRVEEARP